MSSTNNLTVAADIAADDDSSTSPRTRQSEAPPEDADETRCPRSTGIDSGAAPNKTQQPVADRICGTVCFWLRLPQRWQSNLFEERDPSSLAVVRILFGILMLLDIPHERGFSMADKKWGNAELCHFPLIHSMSPLPYEWMCVVYTVMWIGAFGITVGYHFHRSCLSFILTYWYVVLLDKSSWNNHTYLYGLIGLLLYFTRANACWSVDRMRGTTSKDEVPVWNYSILRFQTFILYFMAGLKKVDADWLSGYSMRNLSDHWVFSPFRLYFSGNLVDLWIVHVTGFLIDAFAGFGLQFRKTRTVTLMFLFAFHFMNSRMFQIGVFPYVGMATMFIFCDFDWPRKLLSKFLRFTKHQLEPQKSMTSSPESVSNAKKWTVTILILVYAAIQLFLPFSHFITKGYNGWTNGLYGYSWDMMVHSWDNSMSVIKLIDKTSGQEYFLSADDWVLNKKWMKHPDMVIQFARCVRRNLKRKIKNLNDISIMVDFWFSLNGRFHQRMFDPRVDLLTAKWSPFEKVPWVMPLLTELSNWRVKLQQIRDETYGRANNSEVIFIADFPGLALENFVNEDLTNVTLTLLEGRIQVSIEDVESRVLYPGDKILLAGDFHRISTISETPSCYMFSYYNTTLSKTELPTSLSPMGQVRQEMKIRLADINRSLQLAVNAVATIILKFVTCGKIFA